MERVLEEAEKAGQDFAADPVHDLRVALRRCRSMADGFMAVDPDRTWKAMSKEGRRLFRGLGELRDAQVMMEWVRRHATPDDPAAAAMLAHLAQREEELKRAAAESLRGFDRERWRGWIGRLHGRARRLPPGCAIFQLSAVRAWTAAHELHKQAVRNRSAASYHRLRIGLKKFRYLVENFLPVRHAEWGHDLKALQDLLGEAHDLSVLWNLAVALRAFGDDESRQRWRAPINDERARLLRAYRERTVGSASLWNAWRHGLPPQSRLQSLSLGVIRKWAFFHGINLARVPEVRRFALALFDGLKSRKSSQREDLKSQRAILHAAAILHNAGRAKGRKKEEKATAGLLRQLPPLPGFSADSVELTAMVVRCHRGRFRGMHDADFASLPEDCRQAVVELAGMLRLARTLARTRECPIRQLKARRLSDSIVILAEGYSEFGGLAAKVARARYMLECAYQMPILIRNLS